MADSRLSHYAALFVALLACASSVVFIRESSQAPIALAAYRTLGGALLLSPLFFRALAQSPQGFSWRDLRAILLPAAILAAHFLFWNIGARATPAANATLLVNLTPLGMVIFLWLMFGERPSGREWLATALVIAGVAIVALPQLEMGANTLKGDAMCVLAMLLFAAYLASAKRFNNRSVWLYLVPLYAVAGVFCMLASLASGETLAYYGPYDTAMTVATAVVPTAIGHSILNRLMQLMRGQTVAVVNTFQFVIAGVYGALIYNEVPSGLFYLGSAVVVLGLLVLVNASDEH